MPCTCLSVCVSIYLSKLTPPKTFLSLRLSALFRKRATFDFFAKPTDERRHFLIRLSLEGPFLHFIAAAGGGVYVRITVRCSSALALAVSLELEMPKTHHFEIDRRRSLEFGIQISRAGRCNVKVMKIK